MFCQDYRSRKPVGAVETINLAGAQRLLYLEGETSQLAAGSAIGCNRRGLSRLSWAFEETWAVGAALSACKEDL